MANTNEAHRNNNIIKIIITRKALGECRPLPRQFLYRDFVPHYRILPVFPQTITKKEWCKKEGLQKNKSSKKHNLLGCSGGLYIPVPAYSCSQVLPTLSHSFLSSPAQIYTVIRHKFPVAADTALLLLDYYYYIQLLLFYRSSTIRVIWA